MSIAACAAAVMASLFYLDISSRSIPTQTSQQQAMTLPSLPPDVINHQRQCARDAREQVHRVGWGDDPSAHVTQHYNERLERCFVEIDTVSANAGAGVVFSYQLSDTHGREYANFVSAEPVSAVSASGSWPMCAMTMSSGETIECTSFDEFKEFVRNYMQ